MPTSLGPAEILVILVVALIVLGPKRLPEAARQVGKTLAEIRKWSQGIQDEVRNAMDIDSVPPTYPSPPPPEPTPIPTLPAETAPPDETVVLPEMGAANGHAPAVPAEPDETVVLPEIGATNGQAPAEPAPAEPAQPPAPPDETVVLPEIGATNGQAPATSADQGPADQAVTQQLDLPGGAGPPADPSRN